VLLQESAGKIPDAVKQLPGNHRAHQILNAGEIFLVVIGDDGRLPELVDPGAGGRLGVKGRQPGGDAVQVFLPQLPPVCNLVHHALLGQAHHLQGVIQGLAPAAQAHL